MSAGIAPTKIAEFHPIYASAKPGLHPIVSCFAAIAYEQNIRWYHPRIWSLQIRGYTPLYERGHDTGSLWSGF